VTAIIAGAAPVMMLGSPVPMVAILIVLKTILDIHMHVRSHARLTAKGG